MMALIMPGPLVGDLSGAVGGVVFARGRGGLTARNRTTPLNPQSVRQSEIRQSLATVTNRWTTVLTEEQREAWTIYADNVPVQNRLGQQRHLSGQQMYIRGNVLLDQVGMDFADDGPTIFTAGRSTTPTITIDEAADEFDITALPGIDLTDGPIGLFVAQGKPQNAAVNFYKSPFRFAFATEAVVTTNAPPFEDNPLPFPVSVGQTVFMRSTTVEPDGRVGVPVIQRFPVA